MTDVHVRSLTGDPGPDLPEFDSPPAEPWPLVGEWLAHARDHVPEPYAFTLATVDEQCRPSTRTLLLLDVTDEGLVFGSSWGSRKGREASANPWAAATFFWRETVRQLNVAGRLTRLGAEESDRLFAERPLPARAAAAVVAQSAPLDDERAMRDAAGSQVESGEVHRPDDWAGFLLAPERLELWHGRLDRLHRRLEYARTAEGWVARRLQP
jgi:dihydrophenazinedicarboxylate synthase